MTPRITIQVIMNLQPEVFPKAGSGKSYKTCPYCGQGKIPFKLGVCMCGRQVGDIKYVVNAKKFALGQYYSYISTPKVEKLAIEELMDN